MVHGYLGECRAKSLNREHELIADSDPAILDAVATDLIAQIGRKLDLGVFEGAGSSNEPTGLKNVSGINEVSMGTNGAAPTNLDKIADAIYELQADNANPTALVMHPRTLNTFRKLLDGANRPLLVPPTDPGAGVAATMLGVPVYVTSQLSITETQSTSTDCSSVYLVEVPRIVVVMRSDVTVERGRERLFNSDQSELRVTLRADVLVPQPTAVCRTRAFAPSRAVLRGRRRCCCLRSTASRTGTAGRSCLRLDLPAPTGLGFPQPDGWNGCGVVPFSLVSAGPERKGRAVRPARDPFETCDTDEAACCPPCHRGRFTNRHLKAVGYYRTMRKVSLLLSVVVLALIASSCEGLDEAVTTTAAPETDSSESRCESEQQCEDLLVREWWSISSGQVNRFIDEVIFRQNALARKYNEQGPVHDALWEICNEAVGYLTSVTMTEEWYSALPAGTKVDVFFREEIFDVYRRAFVRCTEQDYVGAQARFDEAEFNRAWFNAEIDRVRLGRES